MRSKVLLSMVTELWLYSQQRYHRVILSRLSYKQTKVHAIADRIFKNIFLRCAKNVKLGFFLRKMVIYLAQIILNLILCLELSLTSLLCAVYLRCLPVNSVVIAKIDFQNWTFWHNIYLNNRNMSDGIFSTDLKVFLQSPGNLLA